MRRFVSFILVSTLCLHGSAEAFTAIFPMTKCQFRPIASVPGDHFASEALVVAPTQFVLYLLNGGKVQLSRFLGMAGRIENPDWLPVDFPPYVPIGKRVSSDSRKGRESMALLLRDVIHENQAYTELTLPMLRALVESLGSRYTFRLYNSKNETYPYLRVQGLGTNGSARYLVRRNPRQHQFLDVLEYDPTIYVGANIGPAGLEASSALVASTLRRALEAMDMSVDEFLEELAKSENNHLRDVLIVFDPKLDLPEETFIHKNLKTATIHISQRLLEPGYEGPLLGAILKGVINVLTRVPRGEIKEATTLPLLFIAWVRVVGIEGVREALEAFGLGAEPLINFFQVMMYHANPKAWEASSEGLTSLERKKLFVKHSSALEDWFHNDSNFRGHRLPYARRQVSMMTHILLVTLEQIRPGITITEDGYTRDALPIIGLSGQGSGLRRQGALLTSTIRTSA